MKKILKKIAFTISLISSSYLSAQEIVGHNPVEIFDSAPIPYSLNFSINGGWDTNVSTSKDADSSPFVGAGFSLSRSLGTEATRFNLSLSGGASHFFNDYEGKSEDIEYSGGASITIGRQLTQRLSFSDSLRVSYGREPAFAPIVAQSASSKNASSFNTSYNYPAGSVSRRVGNYLFGVNSASLAIKWTDSVYSKIGYSLSGTLYDENEVANAEDRLYHRINKTLRYSHSAMTSYSLQYGYAFTNFDTANRDSDTHSVYIGIHRKINEYLNLDLNLGGQLRDSDIANSFARPSITLVIPYNLNERTNITWNNYLGFDDAELGEFAYRYSFRSSLGSSFQVSERIRLGASASFVTSDYSDSVEGSSSSSLNENGITAGVRLGINLRNNLMFNIGYNYSTYISDDSEREYDRSSVGAGISYSVF